MNANFMAGDGFAPLFLSQATEILAKYYTGSDIVRATRGYPCIWFYWKSSLEKSRRRGTVLWA